MENQMIKKNNFTFSIICSIYNNGKYLRESIDSVIFQSLNFEEHVQLILVNDGSTDNSLDIALEYENRFPNNILVISQENQGLSNARNYGLNYVKGTYVNFLDPNDYISKDTLKEVKCFFEKYYNDVDLVSIKICTCERNEEKHPLNFKFNKNKVIDLIKEPINPQLHIASSFIKYSSFKNRRFKLGLVSSEDANMVCKILLEKKKLGVLKSPTYFYRKCNDNSSLMDSVFSKEDYFTEVLKNHFMDVIDYCLEKEGEIPSFIQYILAYNIQWMVIPDFPEFFNEEDKKEFMHYFEKVLSYLSIDSLSSKRIIKNSALRSYLISKYNNDFHVGLDFKNNEVFIKSKDKKLDRLGNHLIWINQIELNDDYLNIFCSFNSMFDSNNLFFHVFKENKSTVEVYSSIPLLDDIRENINFFSETINYYNPLCFRIPLSKDEPCNFTLSVIYRNIESTSTNSRFIFQFPKISFRKECIMNNNVPFLVTDSNILLFENNVIKIENFERMCGLIEDSGLFDEKFYLNQFVNFDKSKNPLIHYLQKGFLEGKDPSKEFNNNLYLKFNPEVKDKNVNPLLHYILYGITENIDIYPKYDSINDRVLTKEIFDEKLFDDPHYKDKWQYLYEVITQVIKFEDLEMILELAPYKSPLVEWEDVMDINENYVDYYPYSIRNFICHDYSKIPYPIEDKKYDLVIACQVLEHCGIKGEQKMVFNELERISNLAIITLPYKWFNPQNRAQHMIDENVFDYWAGDRKYIYQQILGDCILRIYEFK